MNALGMQIVAQANAAREAINEAILYERIRTRLAVQWVEVWEGSERGDSRATTEANLRIVAETDPCKVMRESAIDAIRVIAYRTGASIARW